MGEKEKRNPNKIHFEKRIKNCQVKSFQILLQSNEFDYTV